MAKFDFLEEQGLHSVSKGVYAGTMRGFRTVVKLPAESNTKISFVKWSAYRDGDEEVLREFLDPVKSMKGVTLEVKEAVVKVQFSVPFTEKGTREKFEEIAETTLNILSANGYRSGSFISGTDDGTLALAERGGDYFYLTESEFHQASEELEQEKEEDQYRSENMLLGLLGVLGVGILGTALYVLVGMLGYYVWLVPVGLVFGSYFLYRKMAGKITVKSLVLIFVVMAAVIVVATYLEYGLHLYNYFKTEYDVTYFEVLEETKNILWDEPEAKRSFIRDIVINGAALLIATIICYASTYRQEVRFQQLRKVE